MRHRVIVGYDGSPESVAAYYWARDEARRRASQLVACTVVRRRRTAEPTSPTPALPVDLSTPPAGGVPRTEEVTRVFPRGDAARMLVRSCRSDDLLVLGARGRGPLATRVLGSVSHSCLVHAPCPVVVVNAHPPDGLLSNARPRVVVGLEETRRCRQALRVASVEAALRGAELEVLHIVHWDALGRDLTAPTSQQLVSWGQRLVENELAATGIAGTPAIVLGDPAESLVAQAVGADLLVLGPARPSAVSDVVLGSTTERCLAHTHTPVMVVPAPVSADPRLDAPTRLPRAGSAR